MLCASGDFLSVTGRRAFITYNQLLNALGSELRGKGIDLTIVPAQRFTGALYSRRILYTKQVRLGAGPRQPSPPSF